MEDANQSQLDVLTKQAQDIRKFSDALVSGSADLVKKQVEKAVSQYISSSDNVERIVADQISEKIMFSLRETAKK